MPRLISSGVWSIYLQPQDGQRLLDGEETDSGKARRSFRRTIAAAPATTRVELVGPDGRIVDHSHGVRVQVEG